MKRTYALLFGFLAAFLLAPVTWAFDAEMARGFAQMFEPVHGAEAGDSLKMMSPEELVVRVMRGESIAALDVGMPADGIAMPDALAIPINELFKPESLERIPTDKMVLVLCKSGTRATAAGTALRYIGFDNVYVLKGGLGALVSYLSQKPESMPLAETEWANRPVDQDATCPVSGAGSSVAFPLCSRTTGARR